MGPTRWLQPPSWAHFATNLKQRGSKGLVALGGGPGGKAPLALLPSHHPRAHRADAFDDALEQIAAADRRDAFGGAAVDEIAGGEGDKFGEVGDRFCHAPDQQREVRGLSDLAVDLEL